MTEQTPIPVLDAYIATLAGRNAATIDAYQRTLRQFVVWIAQQPGSSGDFAVDHLTHTAVVTYLAELRTQGYSAAHQARLVSATRGFARWLIDETAVLRRDPTRGVRVPAQALLAPRELSRDQRFLLHTLVERDGQLRSAALFCLGYWAGCRVSDVAWLRMDHLHLTPKTGWMQVGYKGGKTRDIDLIGAAQQALRQYTAQGRRDPDSAYVFPSQRADQLTVAGIHHWFRGLKAHATHAEWLLIADITFHDLRHDFAHRARAAGWSLEELAYYLGHVTHTGQPAIQATARYTQVSRAAVKEKLQLIAG